MRAFAFLVLLAAGLAGCFGGDSGEDGDGDNDTDGPPRWATVEVPFPTMDSCRSPQDWMAGTAPADAEQGSAVFHVSFDSGGPSGDDTTAELRQVGGNSTAADDRSGWVLAVSGHGSVAWSSHIELGPACNTLRYDPWTIDPDAENGTVEVRVTDGSVTHASVTVRRVRDGCGEANLYEGAPTADWSPLEGRSVAVGECPTSA